jgi:hypothetical protein
MSPLDALLRRNLALIFDSTPVLHCLFVVFRSALRTAANWNRGCSISRWPMTPSGMRPISCGEFTARTLPSPQPWDRRTPFSWRCTWEEGCGGGFMDPSALSGHWTGELCFCMITLNCIILDLFLWVGGLGPLVFACGEFFFFMV